MCKAECNSKYYKIEIEKRDRKEVGDFTIYHGEYPDILIEHIPEITLIEFFCNFGGLLGMWLGLSLFGILNDIVIKF